MSEFVSELVRVGVIVIMHACVYVGMPACSHACMHACMHARCACTCVCAGAYVRARVGAFGRAGARARGRMCIHRYICVEE